MIWDVVLNIVAQLMFFIVNIFVIPWLAHLLIMKFGDALPEWLRKPIDIVTSWTTGLVADLLSIPILFLTGNKPHDFEFEVDEGILSIDYCYKSARNNWYNPIMMLGRYFCSAIWILLYPAFSILLLWGMLPDTFGSVVAGLSQWTSLQSGVPNLDYFKEMVNAFIDIIWNRLIMGGLNENAVLLVIFVFVFMIFSGNYVPLYDEDAEETKDAVFVFPMIAILITLFNVILATVNPIAYLTITPYINAVGMIALLVIIIKSVLGIIMLCFKFILSLIFRIKG